MRHEFATPWRLRMYPLMLMIGFLGATIGGVIKGIANPDELGFLGGDLPAFYGAGKVVLENGFGDLYNWEAQIDAQRGLQSSVPDGDLLPFVYPPFVVLPYLGLAALPYLAAHALHTTVQLGALLASVLLMRGLLPRVGRHTLAAFCLAFTFYPMFRAVTGGQNTAFSLLILVVMWWWLERDRPEYAGATAALLLFKPQFAIPALGLLILRHPRSAIGAAITGVSLWAVGAMVSGVGWLGWWLDQVGTFQTIDQSANSQNSVGLLGFLEALIGPGNIVAVGLGVVLTLLLAVVLAWYWRQPDAPLDLRMAALACGVMLVPPHMMFYDTGLLVLPFAVLAQRHGRDAFGPLAALFVISLTARVIPGSLGLNPMFLVTIATTIWVARTARQDLRSGLVSEDDGGEAGEPVEVLQGHLG